MSSLKNNKDKDEGGDPHPVETQDGGERRGSLSLQAIGITSPSMSRSGSLRSSTRSRRSARSARSGSEYGSADELAERDTGATEKVPGEEGGEFLTPPPE